MNTSCYALCIVHNQRVRKRLVEQLHQYFLNFCRVMSAENAEEGLRLYHDVSRRGERLWLVICDQSLPGRQGDDLLAEIHTCDQQMMTVLLTERTNLDSAGQTINHTGLKYHLERPWSEENLLAILKNLKWQYEMTTLLNEINLSFASSIDLEETLEAVFYNILHVIQAEAGSIFLVDTYQPDTLVCKICQGPKNIQGLRVPIEKGIVGHVARTGQIHVSEDVAASDMHHKEIDQQIGFETRSMVSVPLAHKHHVLGVIQVINKQDNRTFSHDDIALLRSLSSGAGLAIQNAQYAKRLLQEERIRSELLIAHQIQQGILPDPFEGDPDINFEAINLPAKDVGGDFYDYFQVTNGDFAFFIGDVCGKGIPAAIFMASSRSTIRSQALANPCPQQVIPLSNQLISHDSKGRLFVTVLYGYYYRETGMLHYMNAGHVPGLLFRPSTKTCASLYNANLPLGMFTEESFESASFQMHKGDVLVLYTDGISEAVNMQEEQFGTERLVSLILEHGTKSPKDLLDIILEQVTAFSDGKNQRDDITVMIVNV